MGCGTSKDTISSVTVPPQGMQHAAPDPALKPLQAWSTKDVSAWIKGLSPEALREYTEKLAAPGTMVAGWTEQDLIDAGVTNKYHIKLLLHEQKQLLAAHAPCPGDATAIAAQQQQQQQQQGLLYQPTKAEAYAAVGLTAVGKVVSLLKDKMPFPGGAAADLVLDIIALVDVALSNKGNLYNLQQRCVDLLQLLGQGELAAEVTAAGQAAASPSAAAQAGAYKNIIGRFTALLTEIREFIRDYSSRRWLYKLLSAQAAAQDYDRFCGLLSALSGDANLAVSCAANTTLREIQHRLQQPAPAYNLEQGQQAARLVEELGGVDAVAADPERLKRLASSLSLDTQLTLAKVEQAAQEIRALADAGVHMLIPQPQLRAMWAMCFRDQAAVPCELFWSVLCSDQGLGSMPGLEPDALDVIKHALSRDEAKERFLAHLDLAGEDDVRIQDIRRGIPPDLNLKDIVLEFTRDTGDDYHALLRGIRSNLPDPDPLFCGRESEVSGLAARLAYPKARLAGIVGQGGSGKSYAAVHTVWQLLRDRVIKSGAFMANMRGCESKDAVLGALCLALGITKGVQMEADIIRCLKKLDDKGVCVIIMDNAEDMLQAAPGDLAAVVDALLAACPHCKLLITSRVPILLQQQQQQQSLAKTGASSSNAVHVDVVVTLTQLPVEAAQQLLRAEVEDLGPEDAHQVASACGCLPLVLRLVAGALRAGRMSVEDFLAGGSSATSSSDTIICAILRSLDGPQQLQLGQLSVFPADFDAEGAGKVLALEAFKVTALLDTLRSYNLLTLSAAASRTAACSGGGRSGAGRFVMHTDVRSAAAALLESMEAGGGPHAKRAAWLRYARYVLGCIGQMQELFEAKQQAGLALSLATERSADVGALFAIVAFETGGGSTSSSTSKNAAAAGCTTSSTGGSTAFLYEACRPAGGLRAALCHYRLFHAAGFLLEPRFETMWLHVESALLQQQAAADPGPSTAANASAGAASKGGSVETTTDDGLSLARIQLAAYNYDHGRHARAEEFARSTLEVQQQRLQQYAASGAAAAAATGPSASGAQPAPPVPAPAVAAATSSALLPQQSRLTQLQLAVAEAQHWQGLALSGQGHFAQSLLLFQQALEVRRAGLPGGASHMDSQASLNNVALALSGLGRHSEAAERSRELLALRRSVCGEAHPETYNTMSNLACSLSALGRSEEAEALFEQTLKVGEQVLGKDHMDLAAVLTNYANWARGRGHYTRAEALYCRALDVTRGSLPPRHPRLALPLANLGVMYDALGRYSQSESTLREALDIATACYGHEHPEVGRSTANLGYSLFQQGRYSTALGLFETATTTLAARLGAGHGLVAWCDVLCSDCLQRLGRRVDAKARLATACEKLAAPGSDPADVVWSDRIKAHLMCDEGRFGEAVTLLEQAKRAADKAAGPTSDLVADCLMDLAYARLGRAQYMEAEAMALAADALLKASMPGGKHPGRPRAHVLAAAAATGLGRAGEALALLREASDCYTGGGTAALDRTADVELRVGEALAAQGNFAGAVCAYSAAHRQYSECLGAAHSAALGALAALAQACAGAGDVQAAQQHAQAVLDAAPAAQGSGDADASHLHVVKVRAAVVCVRVLAGAGAVDLARELVSRYRSMAEGLEEGVPARSAWLEHTAALV